MANVKTVYMGSVKSETTDHELISHINRDDEIYIKIECEYPDYTGFIVLDSETARLFYLQLKQQVEQIIPF